MARLQTPSASKKKDRLDTEHVRIFVAIGQSRTLTEAAAALHLPLFTVSRALKRLEASAEMLLVRRDSSGLALTGAGREYFGACLQLLRAHQDVEDILAGVRREPEGTLRIGTPLPFATYVLGAILPEFQNLYPKVRIHIDLYCSDWDQTPKAVHDIFLKPRHPRDTHHHLKLFPPIRQGLFASPDYLERHTRPRHPLELGQHKCLGHTPDHTAFQWNFRRLEEHVSLTPSFSIVVADLDALLELAARSAGIALLPLWRAQADVRLGKLVHVLEEWSPDDLTFCALHNGRTRIASRETAFLDFLNEILGTARDPRCRGEDPSLFFRLSGAAEKP